MYIHDIHILYYFFIGLLGLGVGQIFDWVTKRFSEHKPVLSKDFYKIYLKDFRLNFRFMYLTAIIYVVLLFMFGWRLDLLKYLLITPLLLSAFAIDYKEQIIPNRLTLTLFEIGLIFAFIEGSMSFSMMLDKLLGLAIGGGIFLIITLIGGLIAGKEAMGFGDVKLMGAIGIIFGAYNIVIISILSFLLAAVISIILIVSKKKKTNEYIPFGPFIVIATLMVILVPENIMLLALLKVFTLGTYKG